MPKIECLQLNPEKILRHMLEKLKKYLIDYKIIQDTDFSYFGSKRLAQFKIGSRNYVAEYDSINDPVFFRIMLPIVDTINNTNRSVILERVVKISSSFKVGKVITVGENIWISAEVFIYNTENTNLLFARLIDVLDSMFDQYRKSDGK